MRDPTYVKSEIEANPIWHLAWRMSEYDNDDAPIGWFKYTNIAHWLIMTFDMKEKKYDN